MTAITVAEPGSFGQLAPALAANGYSPVPLHRGRKNPIPRGWQNYTFTEGDEHRFATAGTGILTGDIVAVDIDVLDPELADRVSGVVVRLLGAAPWRVGQWPKRVFIYRTDTPFTKKSTRAYRLPGDAPDAKGHRVEILARGQQFVAFGIHPKTGKPYTWDGADDPLAIPAEQLNSISETQCDALIVEIDMLLGQHGAPAGNLRFEDGRRGHVANENLRGDPRHVRDALAAIPNSDLVYDDWVYIGMAIKGALGEEGVDAWGAFSAKSKKKYDAAETTKTWMGLKPIRIGAGTLFHLARQQGWESSMVPVISRDIQLPTYLCTPETVARAAESNVQFEIPRSASSRSKAELAPTQFEVDVPCTYTATPSMPSNPAQSGRSDDQDIPAPPYAEKSIGITNPVVAVRGFEVPGAVETGGRFRAAVSRPIAPGTTSVSTQAARVHLNNHYAWIDKQAMIWRFDHRDFIRVPEFRTALAPQPPVQISSGNKPNFLPLADAWLRWSQRRCHRDVVYEPGKPGIVEDCVNLWRGWGCAAAPGDITPWHQLMDYVFAGDPGARTYFEQWVAHQIQQPGEKLNTAVVLWSTKQGVGKTLIGESIGRLFGPENFIVITATELHSQFNGWARGKQFVLGEENASDNRRADANMLKHLITGESLQINQKYQPAVTLRNTLNFLFTSNHPDAFHLDLHDRRFLVWEITGERLSDDFYAGFVHWRDSNGGLPALMHHFQRIDLAGFNAKAAAPMTGAKKDMVDLSRSDLERWLVNYVDGAVAWDGLRSEVLSLDEVATEYLRATLNRVTTTAIGKALSRLGLKQSRRILVGGVRRSLQAIRRPDYWATADNDAWATEYCKQITNVPPSTARLANQLPG